jgi:hypothetical protein
LLDGAERLLDGVIVSGINSSLDPISRSSIAPQRLAANRKIAFKGTDIGGVGFTLQPEVARALIASNPRNSDVLMPFLNGQDLNSRPDGSASRWVINFHDWSEEVARQYRECFDQVVRNVKPERDKNNRKIYRDYWWRFAERRPGMLSATSGLARLIVITLHTKTVMPVMVDGGQVFSHALGVLATDDPAMLALLSSAQHYWWAMRQGSSIKGDLRYTPTDVFEKLARPDTTADMGRLGDRLDSYRRELMLARNAGLTATYNLLHNAQSTDEDIVELRRIHAAIDEEVARAYGWEDLDLDHGFHNTRQGARYTVGPLARQEILDRLLELNHERYAYEQAAGVAEPVQEELDLDADEDGGDE